MAARIQEVRCLLLAHAQTQAPFTNVGSATVREARVREAPFTNVGSAIH
jgi:hypothetical protein